MDKVYPIIGRESITMRWGDMDAVGHLNNTYYFRFMEQIRIQWLDRIVLPIDPTSVGPVIGSTSCVFKKAITYPAIVDITLEVEKMGRSSVRLRHHFYVRGDLDQPYATGEATLVWNDYQTGKTIPIPEKIRALVYAAGYAD